MTIEINLTFIEVKIQKKRNNPRTNTRKSIKLIINKGFFLDGKGEKVNNCI